MEGSHDEKAEADAKLLQRSFFYLKNIWINS